MTATNIEIIDYMPGGLSFQGVFNPGWGVVNGNPVFTYTGELAPGESTTIELKMQVREGSVGDGYINYAEITRATNTAGQEMDDIDSVADNDATNDNGGQPGAATDDMYLDNGQMDEDDHDPAFLEIFDLALMKTNSFIQTVKPGDDVIFLFQVYNQGNVPSTSVSLTDYFPAGLELSPNDTYGWVQSGQTATINVDEEIAPGESLMVYMIARVTEDARPGEVVNFSEITEVDGPNGEDYKDKDFDSSPDDDMNNDNGGEPEGPTDNVIDDNGTTDEDDHDPSTLNIFDLALRKTVDRGVSFVRR